MKINKQNPMQAGVRLLCFLLSACALLSGCAKGTQGSDRTSADETVQITDTVPEAVQTTNAVSEEAQTTEAVSEAAETTEAVPEETAGFDPYAVENIYNEIDQKLFKMQSGVDYGTVIQDLTYPSTVAEDDKQCNVLLPAGYDENETYPVMYVIHGFGEDHRLLINDRSDCYLVALYGNLLHRGLTVPMIIVSIDMYTDPQADKAGKTDAALKRSYNKVIEEIHTDLMPFIEKNYPVSTAREDTAVAGVSEGAGKTLCIGFTWPEAFGWIGAFSPNAGVIPTEFDKGTFWNDPVLQEFPELTEDETPRYLYLAVGSADIGSMDPTLYYRDVLDERGIRNQTDLVEGYGHLKSLWQRCFYNFLTKVFR